MTELCGCFRDLGGRTFRCTLTSGHSAPDHQGISGQLRNYWQDGALGAMGQRYNTSAPLPSKVAPLEHWEELNTPETDSVRFKTRIGPPRQPYPNVALAVPNDNDPTENQDAGAQQAVPPVLQPDRQVLPTTDDGPGYGATEDPANYTEDESLVERG